jgi:hypothetical protein
MLQVGATGIEEEEDEEEEEEEERLEGAEIMPSSLSERKLQVRFLEKT